MSNRLAVRADTPCALDSIDMWKTAAEWALLDGLRGRVVGK